MRAKENLSTLPPSPDMAIGSSLRGPLSIDLGLLGLLATTLQLEEMVRTRTMMIRVRFNFREFEQR